MYEVGGPNPKGGGGVFPLATKIPQVFHRSGKVFLGKLSLIFAAEFDNFTEKN
jgi:hypothetical protein